MEIAIITLISTAGLATISRIGVVGGINIYNYYVRKKDKYRLKKRLKESIKDGNYEDFQQTIYRIKAYDNTYNKYLYIKMQQKYRFDNKCNEDIYYFNKRFNINNLYPSPSVIRTMIRDEIELSLSKKVE